MPAVTSLVTVDLRFPTSKILAGSDAMNPDPDYSAAYLTLHTDAGERGDGFVFTIGRGNDVQVAAIQAMAPFVVGLDMDDVLADLGEFSRRLVYDSQLRWLGPEKGVMHMAIGAVINAVWDLAARRAHKPLWEFLSDMPVDQIVDLVDFRYLSDVITPGDATDLLKSVLPGRAARATALRADGYPAYTTEPGWLGYSDEKMARLAREAVADGFSQIKLKVGADLSDDLRRLQLARQTVGPEIRIALDANQRWDVSTATAWMRELAPYDPTWIEEPTSPDDILAHAEIRKNISPIRVATGEHVQNRVIFKQLLQAQAVDVVQMDATRVGGINENVAILLLAAHFGVPVCPHAGGIGLCELVQHLSMFDYVAVSGSLDDRMIEHVAHLHEHFVNPAVVQGGRYRAPAHAGFSAQILDASIAQFRFPDGAEWRTE
jgi:L-alanine-DL-glutamate epimerase and related enzymes of enolase superfamily